MQRQVAAREKGPKDLVSEADVASQQFLRRSLLGQFPDYGFVGEEDPDSWDQLQQHEYCWVVDPLDGTSNYVHGIPSYAVSVALWHQDRALVGVVWDPVLQELFRAAEGHGALLNGKAIRPSSCTRLADALVAASLSPMVPRGSVEVARLVEAIHEAQGVRRTGSAALNLCYVAAGRFDGYWATSVRLWDVAAGALLVRESGGIVSNLEGGPVDWRRPQVLVSATDALHGQLVAMLRRAEAVSGAGGCPQPESRPAR